MDGDRNARAEILRSSGDELVQAGDPFEMFDDWLALATRHEISDANAMALATSDAEGLPNVRMVLLKSFGPQGFVFYTNSDSLKGGEIAVNAKAAAVLHWKSLERQIRLRGPVVQVAEAEADAYFASRAKDSQIGAWASQQSRPLPDRFALEKAVAVYAAKHGLGTVPRPPYWSGFRLLHERLEFWTDKPFRLHDREVFTREGAGWTTVKLFP